jgi:hypothetical protein
VATAWSRLSGLPLAGEGTSDQVAPFQRSMRVVIGPPLLAKPTAQADPGLELAIPSSCPPPGAVAPGDTDHTLAADAGWAMANAAASAHASRLERRFMAVLRLSAQVGLQ